MPRMKPSDFGKRSRIDGKPGYEVVTPTMMKFVEADHTDVRMRRVRVLDGRGKLVEIYLLDTMGVHFQDLPNVGDDLSFLRQFAAKPEKR